MLNERFYMTNSNRYRLRMILPAFSNFNIYSDLAKVTTSLGPICVATSASKLELWDVEVIDENNCRDRFCPVDKEGRPDHEKIQKERPADVVGFYGSLTSTIPRLFGLAALYKSMGAITVTGGKHVENLPEESLNNSIDVVVLGEGEDTIGELLLAWQNCNSVDNVAGIAFLKNGKMVKTAQRQLITDFDRLPYPDFSLLRYGKLKYYPVGRIRGCNMNCEFCAVKDNTRCATPQRVMNQIAHLVETRKAKKFFEVSDHFAADRDSAIEFCRLVAAYRKKNRVKFSITVQIRINNAEDTELLKAMRDAGVNNLAIGIESPIDEELKAMRKGYLSKDMISWTQAYHKYGFFIHGMFIFGYPVKKKLNQISLQDKVKRFRNFLVKAKIDTAQILMTIPLPGTDLRKRLEAEGKLYPLSHLGWEYYDGQFPLYEPGDGVSPEELQDAVVKKIMSRFYRFRHLGQIILNILFHFPRIVFPAAFSIVTFKAGYIINAFLKWKRLYFRNYLLRFGGYIILKNWIKKFKKDKFLVYLAEAKTQLHRVKNKAKSQLHRIKGKATTA